jgi:hypothetical protein
MWLQVLIIAYYYRIDLNGTCPGCLDAFAAAGTFRRGPCGWHWTIVPSVSFASGIVMVLDLKRVSCDLLLVLHAAWCCVGAA